MATYFPRTYLSRFFTGLVGAVTGTLAGGGVFTGGAATVVRGYAVFASGGVLLSGDVVPAYTPGTAPNGNVVTGGVAATQALLHVFASGGVTVYGTYSTAEALVPKAHSWGGKPRRGNYFTRMASRAVQVAQVAARYAADGGMSKLGAAVVSSKRAFVATGGVKRRETTSEVHFTANVVGSGSLTRRVAGSANPIVLSQRIGEGMFSVTGYATVGHYDHGAFVRKQDEELLELLYGIAA